MDKPSVKLATVRFKKDGKQYDYIVPDWCKDKIWVACYVIVPDKVTDKRYSTAQCIRIRTETYENLNPNINYEYIVDVVDGHNFEQLKKSLDRGKKIEAIAEAIKDYTDTYGGFFSLDHEIDYDNQFWESHREPCSHKYTFTMTVPFNSTTITLNDTPLLAKGYSDKLIH